MHVAAQSGSPERQRRECGWQAQRRRVTFKKPEAPATGMRMAATDAPLLPSNGDPIIRRHALLSTAATFRSRGEDGHAAVPVAPLEPERSDDRVEHLGPGRIADLGPCDFPRLNASGGE
jgi:hypothetical protein